MMAISSDKKTFADVMALVKTYINKEEDLSFISKAFDFANKKHYGQFRKSGDPYISHCIEVAYILAYYKMDPITIAAGLLHDVLEDCGVSAEEITQEFNEDTTKIVKAVTRANIFNKIGTEDRASNLAKTYRSLLLAAVNDGRAIIVKLADRLHNMRTLQFHTPEKQKRISQETLEVYAPLAHRLGMNEVKNELENLSLYYLDRPKYLEIEKLINDKLSVSGNSIDLLIENIKKLLDANNIKYRIFGRTKSVYSVYKKIYIKNFVFEKIFDLQAIRIITDTKMDCYEILGLIHSEYRPLPGRFKDYIAMQKPNMYQSLHTTIMDQNANIFEVQIRTEEMDIIAEKGIAAHWIYKESENENQAPNQKNVQQELIYNFLRRFTKINEEESDQENDQEYVNHIIHDIFEANVYVLTPKGRIIDLPQGATPIDFAYRIHSDVGNRTIGAIVNKVMVPLNTVLKTGDVVEIKTSKNFVGGREDWLQFVKTGTAKKEIKKAIAKKAELDSKNTDDDFYKKGIALLDATIKNRDVNRDEIYNSLNQLSVLNYFEVASANDLIIAIGRKSISAQLVVSQCINLQPNLVVQINQMLKKNNANVSKKESKHDISIKGATGIKVETAPCCCPIPGDDIVGFITRGKGVKVHRINCPNIVHEKRRLIETTWNEVLDLTYYPVNLEIESVDRGNLVVDLMSMISLCKIKIDSISAKSHYETKTATISCTVYVSDVNHLDSLITKLKQIQGIYEVRRVFH